MRLGEDLVGLAVKRVTKFVERGIPAPEGPITSGLPTLGAECLVSAGKPTVI
jgi:hypothetical protein